MQRKRKEMPSKWTLATRILTERQVLLKRLARLDQQHPTRDPGGHSGDNTPTSEVMETAQECLAKELEFASRDLLTARLRTLERAEEKIREGSYGRCDVCGRAIPVARLRAMPEAVRCVPCAEG